MSKLLAIVVLVCYLHPFGLVASESAVDVPLRVGVRGIHMSQDQQTAAVEPQPILTPEQKRQRDLMASFNAMMDEHPVLTVLGVAVLVLMLIVSTREGLKASGQPQPQVPDPGAAPASPAVAAAAPPLVTAPSAAPSMSIGAQLLALARKVALFTLLVAAVFGAMGLLMLIMR